MLPRLSGITKRKPGPGKKPPAERVAAGISRIAGTQQWILRAWKRIVQILHVQRSIGKKVSLQIALPVILLFEGGCCSRGLPVKYKRKGGDNNWAIADCLHRVRVNDFSAGDRCHTLPWQYTPGCRLVPGRVHPKSLWPRLPSAKGSFRFLIRSSQKFPLAPVAFF